MSNIKDHPDFKAEKVEYFCEECDVAFPFTVESTAG